MRDLFYTILIVWVVWRILNSVNTMRSKKNASANTSSKKAGETTVDYIPPKKKSPGNDEGEYVDYEEMK